MDASGVYVGMTRGQSTNRLHAVAGDVDDVREQFTAALERDRADRRLVAATRAAHEAVSGLAADGPVLSVNAERARLTEQVERAERQAKKWEQVQTALDRQRQAHRAESDKQEETVAVADARSAQVRAEDAVRRRRGGLPTGADGVERWADMVAGKHTAADPRVTERRKEAQQAHREQGRMVDRQMRQSIALSQRALGNFTASRVIAHAAKLRKQAERDRRDPARIEVLPVTDAAQFVRERTPGRRPHGKPPSAPALRVMRAPPSSNRSAP